MENSGKRTKRKKNQQGNDEKSGKRYEEVKLFINIKFL